MLRANGSSPPPFAARLKWICLIGALGTAGACCLIGVGRFVACGGLHHPADALRPTCAAMEQIKLALPLWLSACIVVAARLRWRR
jgi:hypothetical protein